jgi:carboxymethylenebutenolidase
MLHSGYMKKAPLIVGFVFIVLVGAGLLYKKGYLTGDRGAQPTPMKNAEMLSNGDVTPVITQSDVEYYPGAKGYFVRPAKEGNYPGVIMIHENRGLRPEIKATAEQLAKEGYLVLAVDLYNGKVLETQEEARANSANFKQDEGLKNLKAAVAYLKQKGATKMASLGWCFGGGQSLQLSLSGEPLDATVIYYGRLVTKPEELAPIKWPVLGVFGEEDQSITKDTVKEFDAALDTRGIENEIYVYPGVGHAFANPSGMNYAPEETKDAWTKTTEFLKKHLQ